MRHLPARARWCRVVGLLLLAQSIAGPGWAATEPEVPAKPAPLPTLPLSLRGALSAAADNNPDVQLYRERIAAAESQVNTQLGALLPNFASSVKQSRQTQFLGTFGLSAVRSDPFSIFDARVNASQNLLSVSLIRKWRASRQSLQATEYDAESRKYDVMASVALTYMEGLKALGMVKMHEANQQIVSDLLGMVKQRQKGGVATGLDIARLEGQLASERQQTASARYEVQHAKLTVLNFLSLPYETPVVLTDEFKNDVDVLVSSQTAVETALADRPEVQSQVNKVKTAELTYASITGERLPSLVAQGDTGMIGNRVGTTLQTYNMALLLQIPIFDGGQREGRIGEAKSQLRQEALRLRSVMNQVSMEVHDALASLAAAKEQVAIAQAGLQAATKELDLAKERFVVLTASNYFELTNGISSVARARENLVNALFQLNSARVHYARSTGSLKTLN